MSTSKLPTIHILFENPDWLPPLEAGLRSQGFDIQLWKLDSGSIDPLQPPPEGVWINRISPSSHTRGHDQTVGLTRDFLYWLESYGRTVINGSTAFEIEMSKLRQDLVLRRYGILTPRTVLAVGREQLLQQAELFSGAFITKHNQGGKGLGIHKFDNVEGLRAHLDSSDFDAGPESKIILQEYIQSPEPRITRVELVGGRLLYAMYSATTQGFELCPSDACQLQSDVCPADGSSDKFSAREMSPDDPLVTQYLRLMHHEGISIAGIEFIEDAQGRRYTYDINGTTNYSGALVRETGVDGMVELARHIRYQVVPDMRMRRAS
jgi:hypothetical protein